MKPSNKNRTARPATVPYIMVEPKEVQPLSVNKSIVYVTVFILIMTFLFMYNA